MNVTQYTPPFMSRLPGPLGHRFYKRWKEGLKDSVEAQFEEAQASLGPNDLCLDLGANVGEITGKLAATGAKVISYEPDPLAFELLRSATKHLPNVELRNAAIGGTAGQVELYRSKTFDVDSERKTQGSSVVRNDRWSMDRDNTISVRQDNFFDVIESLPSSVSLLKIDIEGAEWPILEGLAEGRCNGKIRDVFVETHERFDTFRLMPKLLTLVDQFAKMETPKVNLFWV